MSWWNPSWLFTLPSLDFSLPAGIQRRFLSFLLNRFLGHFVKPGQLDVQNIDSQIGSGYVQVKDIQLDPASINTLISGLPIRLHEGSVGFATVRIPWPNPLTSSLGLSVNSLHLIFHLESSVPQSQDYSANLAESVASVAESFIHEGLSPGEEATLRESFHPDLGDSLQDHVPGGLDPFLSGEEEKHPETDPEGVSMFASLIERLLARFAFDAVDTQITIIDPRKASFTLRVPGIKYGTETKAAPSAVGPVADSHSTPQSPANNFLGETRTVQITGPNITYVDLRPRAASPTSFSRASTLSSLSTLPPLLIPHGNEKAASQPTTPLSSSSGSEMDEETQLFMSQSLAFLPPRTARAPSPSLASSVASSMYQSATSIADRDNKEEHPTVMDPEPEETPEQEVPETSEVKGKEEIIVSFGTEPLVIRLTTPPPAAKPPTKSSDSRKDGADGDGETLQLSVTMGMVSLALRSRHIHDLLELSGAWAGQTGSRSNSGPPSENPLGTPIWQILDVSVHLRGFFLLLLPPVSDTNKLDQERLSRFFDHPLSPLRLSHGYIRAHLDSISCSMSTTHSILSRGKVQPSGLPPKSSRSSTTVTFAVADVSVFLFSVDPASITSSTPEHSALPILITDPQLASQYPLEHLQPSIGSSTPQLFSFDIVDWTHPTNLSGAAKSSIWRTKSPHHSHHKASSVGRPGSSVVAGLPSSLGKIGGDLPPRATQSPSPAVTATVNVVSRFRGTQPSQPIDSRVYVEVAVVPFHVFLDMGRILGEKGSLALDFVKDLAPSSPRRKTESEADTSEPDIGEGEEMSTPPATPRARQAAGIRMLDQDREKERKRLEKLVLEDLDLSLDYRPEPTRKPSEVKVKNWRKEQSLSENEKKFQFIVKIPMIRLQVRCPSPVHATGVRSGSLVLDVHDLSISPGASAKPSRSTARFSEEGETARISSAGSNVLISVEFRRLVLAYALVGQNKATVIISIGPLSTPHASDITSPHFGASPSSMETVSLKSPLNPSIVISKSARTRSLSTAPTPPGTILAMNIPCVHVDLTKPVMDGLQLWADDVSQLMERTFGEVPRSQRNSRETSIVGSNFFVKSRSGSDSETTTDLGSEQVSETIVKVTVSRAFVRINLPRGAESPETTRPFDLTASDLDCLVEFKPEGKDETVVTLGMMEVNVQDLLKSNEKVSLLVPNPSRSNASNPIPLVKLRFTSAVIPGSIAKESRIKVSLHGFSSDISTDFGWATDLGAFFKAPPGAFESVVPSERTRVFLKITEGSIVAHASGHPGALVVHIGETSFSTEIVGEAPDSTFQLSTPSLSVLLIDNLQNGPEGKESENLKPVETGGVQNWVNLGYALITEVYDLDMRVTKVNTSGDTRVTVDRTGLRVHLCADTGAALGSFISHVTAALKPPADPKNSPPKPRRGPTNISGQSGNHSLMSSVDEHAFRRMPEVGAAPDMINDDLPSNLDYLDASFGTAAGFRELRDEDLDEFDVEDIPISGGSSAGVISSVGGETIRVSSEGGIHIVEHYFDTLPPDSADDSSQFGETTLRVRLHNTDVDVLLYDGYDWVRTRRTIEDQVKVMRRRLAKIRQLLASGQTHDEEVEETSALLFNSVYIGLEQDIEDMEPGALIAAIDDELNDPFETASQSSWQSLRPTPSQPTATSAKGKPGLKSTRARHLKRSRGSCIEFKLMSLSAEIDQYQPHESLAARTLVTVRDVEILDHMKTSTWKTFLTELRSDSRGNIRESESNMVRLELRDVKPVPGNPTVESRLRAKLLPLRLHVDQDALDFLKKFFSFKDPEAEPGQGSSSDETYFQQAEVFPIDIKLDYKPRRVDYRALREGKTIELMNFFHFDGSEMTLRHITLSGITGWARLGDLLNDLWTPDVKATQLVDVISGVSPIRSVVNVGSGVADLVLLPIAQYKKDGRVLRGVQKGATSFVKSTAMEAVKLGARLATGTQVILEQAENVLGTQYKDPITAEALQLSPGGLNANEVALVDDDETRELISKYAEQPQDVKEGLQSAYKSLRKNMNSAAQTILAVPMEVYERSSNEGPVRAVIRAVPIAVLKPMIGASEAVSKTLLGLHNTMDPGLRQDTEAKYKQR